MGSLGHLSQTLAHRGASEANRHHEEGPLCRAFESGASRARTGDLLGAIQALSQLSYSPKHDLAHLRRTDRGDSC